MQAPAKSDDLTCPVCGYHLSPTDAFCPICGTPKASFEQIRRKQEKQDKKKQGRSGGMQRGRSFSDTAAGKGVGGFNPGFGSSNAGGSNGNGGPAAGGGFTNSSNAGSSGTAANNGSPNNGGMNNIHDFTGGNKSHGSSGPGGAGGPGGSAGGSGSAGSPGGTAKPGDTSQFTMPQSSPGPGQNGQGHNPDPNGQATRPNATKHSSNRSLLMGAAVGLIIALFVLGFLVPRIQAQTSGDLSDDTTAQQTTDDSTSGTDDSDSSSDTSAQKAETDAQAQAETEEARQRAEQAQAEQQAAQAQAGQDAAESSFHSSLVSYYNALSDYNSRIKTAADNFNNNYTKDDLSLRTSYDHSANSLLSELQQQRDSLYSLSVPSGNSYSSQYTALKRCYDDCVHRIQVIVQAWDKSIQYSNPKDHQSEIIAPMTADNVDGHNKYYTDFNSAYPTISL